MTTIRKLFRTGILAYSFFFAFELFSQEGSALPQSAQTLQTPQASQNSALFGGKVSKINRNYQFKAPTVNDMSFYLVSLDKKVHKYLIKLNDDTYTYIETAPKNTLGMQYALPKSKQIKLYSMSVVENNEVFTEIGSLPTDGLSDFIMAVFPQDGKLTGRAVDLSLENMPIGTMNFVNLQPFTIGVVVDKKPSRLPLFGHFRKALTGKRPILSKPIQVFSLKNPNKPEEFYHTEFIFDKNNRAMIFLMGLTKTKNATDSRDMQQFVEMQNASPR